jgi:hypothetical protein
MKKCHGGITREQYDKDNEDCDWKDCGLCVLTGDDCEFNENTDEEAL